jgi:5-methyltetrahydrofolate--homocysteine methyltransferase
MPDRAVINANFIAMSILAGLSCPITNPLEEEVVLAIKAADLVMGRDELGMNWIKSFRARSKED